MMRASTEPCCRSKTLLTISTRIANQCNTLSNISKYIKTNANQRERVSETESPRQPSMRQHVTYIYCHYAAVHNMCTQNGANRRNGESKTEVSHRLHAECSHGYERSSYCKLIKYVVETLGKHFRCYILFGNTLHFGLDVCSMDLAV